MEDYQQVDLFKPLLAHKKGSPPLVLRVGVQNVDMYTEGGAVTAPIRTEVYVLFSALPEDLRKRVETAIKLLSVG